MRAGRFNTPVKFQAQVKVPNGGGGHSVDWVDQFDRMANVVARPLSDSDMAAQGGGVTNQTDHVCTVRLDDRTREIRPGWRVVIAGRVLAIKSLPLPPATAQNMKMILQEGQPT